MDSCCIIFFKFEEHIYVLVNEDKTICGFQSFEAAMTAISTPYHQNHRRSYEASMSACYHFIFFQPRVGRATVEELRGDVIVPETARLYRCSTIAGTLMGVRCEGPGAQKAYESATPAELVEGRRSAKLGEPEAAPPAAPCPPRKPISRPRSRPLP